MRQHPGMSDAAKRVVLVRHAQCEMNLTVDGHIGGQQNESPLTPLGVQQVAALGEGLRQELAHEGVRPDQVKVFSSTAVRALETAKAVTAALQLDPAVIIQTERLLEMEMGDWTGARRDECFTPELVQSFADEPWGNAWHFAPPGGESQWDLERRMLSYLVDEVFPALGPGERAIVVTHGMSIRCLMRGIFNSVPLLSRNIRVGNTAITEIAFKPAAAGTTGGTNGATNGGTAIKGASNGSENGAASCRAREPAYPLPAGVWQVCRVNDLAHLPLDKRS